MTVSPTAQGGSPGSAQTIPFGHDARAAAVRRVAGVLIEHLHGLAVRSANEIWNREVEFRDTVAGPEDLIDACRVTIGAALRSLETGRLDDDEVEALRSIGRIASRQGTPLEVVLRGLRVDFLVLWSEMLLVARTTDPTTQQSLINASEIVWGAVDAVTAQFTIGYRSNHEARARAEQARREEVLLRALHGDPITADEGLMVLGLSAVDDVVVLVIEGGGTLDLDDLERRLRFASLQSCWARRDGAFVGVVALRGRSAESACVPVEQVAGVRAGVSRVRRGLGELPAGLRDATLALATLRPDVTGVATLFDDPVGSLALAQRDLTASLARHVLGPVQARPARESDLLIDTLVA